MRVWLQVTYADGETNNATYPNEERGAAAVVELIRVASTVNLTRLTLAFEPNATESALPAEL